MAASTLVGGAGQVRLGQGAIHYREVGKGPALLFIHAIRDGAGGSVAGLPAGGPARTRVEGVALHGLRRCLEGGFSVA